MKITRFEQSCLLVEVGSVRILIDPGDGSEGRDVSDFGNLNAVFYTHLHGDHFYQPIFDELISSGVPAYVNQALYEVNDGQGNVVNDQDVLQIDGVEVKAIELPHCLMPDGSNGPQNTGYLINNSLFHPGDGVELEGLSVDVLALPITGPDVSMKDAFAFAGQLKAKTVIPIHYDKLGAKPDVFRAFAERFKMSFETKVLAVDQSVDINF